MKRILFSAVGSTDPIANQHDGAILHIARHWKPDEIYLYYSREMLELEQKDDRYCYCLKKLEGKIGKEFRIHKIIRPDLTAVHVFDYFLNEFRVELEKIPSAEECELLLNVSSGTPAMKSALQVIGGVLNRPATRIQVVTPEHGYNKMREDVKGDYDVVTQWECNLDNEPGCANRCIVSSDKNLLAEINKKIIEKQIANYDYTAALTVAEDIRSFLSPGVICLLEASAARMKLDLNAARRHLADAEKCRAHAAAAEESATVEKSGKCRDGIGYRMFPHEAGDEIELFEYLLQLQIKLRREEYIDFIRGITPLFFELLERIILKKTDIALGDYYRMRQGVNGTMFKLWDIEKVRRNAVINDILTDGGTREIKGGPVGSQHLTDILERKCSDSGLNNLVSQVRGVERDLRNTAAHCITYMTDEVIKDVTDRTPEQIFVLLKNLAKYSGINITDEDLNSYDICNERIKNLL